MCYLHDPKEKDICKKIKETQVKRSYLDDKEVINENVAIDS